jgi:hypothetical protein
MTDKTIQFAWYLAHQSDLFPSIHDKAGRIGVAAGIARKIEDTYWPAWLEHPDYHPSEFADPWNPTAVAVYQHENFQGHDESYMIAGISDLLAPAQMKWGRRTLGTFSCIRPILDEIPVHPTRISYISFSLKGSGRAYRCRMELKRLLPSKYRPLISKARQCARTPKSAYLSEWLLNERAGQAVNLRDRTSLPAWYTQTTRDALNYRKFLDQCGDQIRGIETYITMDNFWMAATGKCHPDEVPGLVTHQIELFVL